MNVGIMQPYFLPYIGYWQLMDAVDIYVVYDDVNYIKGGWVNRNRILINGEPQYFSIPVQKASQNKRINEIEINCYERIISEKLKTIERAYKKAPYFDSVFPHIEQILSCKEINLADYIYGTFQTICGYLGIKTQLIRSSELKKDNSLKGQDKIIQICALLNATEYYNAIGGQALYSEEPFEKNGIKLRFLKTNKIVYQQFKNEFQENLSIIDVMMFNSIDRIREMLTQYTLL